MEIKWLCYVPIYVALCEEQSIAGAAKRLGVSNAHASRQLKQLEELLAVQLIQRTTRQFNLTQDGMAFYQQAKSLLEHAQTIDETLTQSHQVAGKLRVAASASFGALLLSEPFAEFVKLYPEITLEVIFTERPLDLIESGFDVAFFLTDSPPEGYVGHYLRSLNCRPFIHQGYEQQHSPINHPTDLSTLPHIVYKNSEFTLNQWDFIHTNSQETIKITLEASLSVNLVSAMVDMMQTGAGVAMLDEFALAKLTPSQRQKVVQLLPDWQTKPILPLYILYPKREHLAQRTRLFVQHFHHYLCQTPIPS